MNTVRSSLSYINLILLFFHRCLVRKENLTCNATKCQSSSEQYWERYVLSVHKAKLGYQMVQLENGTQVNQTYAFAGVNKTKINILIKKATGNEL